MSNRTIITETQGNPGTAQTYGLEPATAQVYDVTSQTAAIAGKILLAQFTQANASSFGTNFSQAAALSAIAPDLCYGIVQVPATLQGGVCKIVQDGVVNALVTTLTSQIVPGNMLQCDAYGNLCSVGGTILAGSVMAVALSTVVTATNGPGLTTSPVTIPVMVANA